MTGREIICFQCHQVPQPEEGNDIRLITVFEVEVETHTVPRSTAQRRTTGPYGVLCAVFPSRPSSQWPDSRQATTGREWLLACQKEVKVVIFSTPTYAEVQVELALSSLQSRCSGPSAFLQCVLIGIFLPRSDMHLGLWKLPKVVCFNATSSFSCGGSWDFERESPDDVFSSSMDAPDPRMCLSHHDSQSSPWIARAEIQLDGCGQTWPLNRKKNYSS